MEKSFIVKKNLSDGDSYYILEPNAQNNCVGWFEYDSNKFKFRAIGKGEGQWFHFTKIIDSDDRIYKDKLYLALIVTRFNDLENQVTLKCIPKVKAWVRRNASLKDKVLAEYEDENQKEYVFQKHKQDVVL